MLQYLNLMKYLLNLLNYLIEQMNSIYKVPVLFKINKGLHIEGVFIIFVIFL